MLTNVASIAIWNRNKVVVALAMIVMGTSIGFHLQGKFVSSFPSAEDLKLHTNMF